MSCLRLRSSVGVAIHAQSAVIVVTENQTDMRGEDLSEKKLMIEPAFSCTRRRDFLHIHYEIPGDAQSLREDCPPYDADNGRRGDSLGILRSERNLFGSDTTDRYERNCRLKNVSPRRNLYDS